MNKLFAKLLGKFRPSLQPSQPSLPTESPVREWDEIRRRAIAAIQRDVLPECGATMREARQDHGEKWIHYMSVLNIANGSSIPRGHFGFGMNVRNFLRSEGLKDEWTPSGNWDDHYCECLEAAMDAA